MISTFLHPALAMRTRLLTLNQTACKYQMLQVRFEARNKRDSERQRPEECGLLGMAVSKVKPTLIRYAVL